MSMQNMIPEELVRQKVNEIDHNVDLLVEGYEKKIARLEKTNE